MALSSSTSWDFTMASDDRNGYSQEVAITLHSCVSSSVSLPDAQSILLLFLSHIIVVHVTGGTLGDLL